MDSISTARDFFINQQGLSPDQADMIVSKGMEAYNQQNQPQSMMQMASGGIARMGYQMGGGIGTMPMDYGQSLQVPQQMPTNFSSAQSITSNPLLNYGQPQMGQAGGTPLSMNRGGIARLGYQMGGEAGMQQMGDDGMIQMDQQQALQTIIQILIDNGIPPEQAQQLAQQILQIFMQGGAPAVEEFANQLEQQEQAQAMASGGIAGYAQRQGYLFGGIGKAISGAVKGVANAVKSVAKSPIGKIALTIAATYALGPAGLGIGQMASATPWIASAINAGIANTLVQGITTGKFNPMQALTAAALGGVSGAMGVPGTTETANATNITGNTATDFSNVGLGNPDAYGSSTAQQISSNVNAATNAANPINTYGSSSALENVGTQGMNNVGPVTQAAKAYTDPTIMDRVSQFGDTAKAGITNLYQDPLGTIQKAAGSAFDYATDPENRGTIATLGGLTLLGSQLGIPRNEGEDDMSYEKRLKDAQGYITQYGRNLKITNPYFYQREGAVNPFAPTMAANGGIMGYKKGGSMVPPARQIEGGVIELDARKTGGYIPYGKKERHDDVPAMLAKDEFVFTSRAVKAAGGGDAKRGAAKMYAIMKQLEGARA
jgi:hypothetical protein